MTDDQIAALARELADELYNNDSSYRKILWWCEEPKERKAEELEHTIRFLLRRFHLTDKAVVKEMYEKALKGMRQNTDSHTGDATDNHHTLAHYAVCCGQKATLEHIFPEIAKELE